ncbi:hypothetical protein [Chryseobacterium sp.]|uniref:hypothetical protein n=1 Tax=Chryseobacterium sp. TaxID=1871047 RepID=UPI00289DC873|nr:hypothetical protein [Chryseobacterium sp.]
MKNIVIFIFSFLLGCLLLTSCKSKSIPGETTETIIHKTEVVKDTILKVERDSSYYSAYIDCVNGKPVLIQSEKQIREYNEKNPGAYAEAPKSKAGRSIRAPIVNLQDGQLKVDCQKEAESIFFKWRENFVREWQINNKAVPVEKPLTTFQNVKMWIGAIVIWAIGLAALAFLIRFIISKKLI